MNRLVAFGHSVGDTDCEGTILFALRWGSKSKGGLAVYDSTSRQVTAQLRHDATPSWWIRKMRGEGAMQTEAGRRIPK